MTSTKTRSDLTSVNFYRNHISPSIHPDLPILYTWFLTLSSSIIAIISGFDLSIYKRLEDILTRLQHPSLGKQSIWIDGSAGTEQTMIIILRSLAVSLPLEMPKFDVTADDVIQSRHRSGLETMLQSPCDSCKMCEHNVYYLHAWIFLLLDRPICEGLLYCHCGNFVLDMQTLFIQCWPMLGPWITLVISIIDCASIIVGPRSICITSINAWLLD